MSTKQILTLSLAMTAFATHIAFAAGAPENVKTTEVTREGEAITLSWSPVHNAAFYRIYFSHASILDNEGDYDDFTQTTDSEASYTFSVPPLTSERIYFGILAVNADGMESEGFESEAIADLSPPQTNNETPSVVPIETTMPEGERPTSTSQPMLMVSAEAISSTGVLLTFSKNISMKTELTPEFFVITDSGGVVLVTQRVTTEEATVLLTTEEQTPEKLYIVYILEPITATDETSAPSSGATVTFLGYNKEPSTQEQVPTTSSTPPPVPYGKAPIMSMEDPTSLNVSATPRSDGTYDIIARWNPATGADAYGVYTSMDGAGYAPSGVVPAHQTSVKYTNVQPGSFAVKLTSKDSQGIESRGIERSITLPSTGLGVLGIMGVAAAAAGMRIHRRRKTV